MSNATPIRTVRVDDGLWEEAKKVAVERKENLSIVIRGALREYVSNHASTTHQEKP